MSYIVLNIIGGFPVITTHILHKNHTENILEKSVNIFIIT